MDKELISVLSNNIDKTNKSVLNQEFIKTQIDVINERMNELNELLEDINNNNMSNMHKKHMELLIEKESMKPFIKYLMIYNTFLMNHYN
tara:strand:- start:2583 stop:2849 length:267 start_codon:yes stop_codon:yes gene_type:complete